MGYQPRPTRPKFVDEHGNPIPPGMFTRRYNTRDVYAMFGIQTQAEAQFRMSMEWGEEAKAARDAEEHNNDGIALVGYDEL